MEVLLFLAITLPRMIKYQSWMSGVGLSGKSERRRRGLWARCGAARHGARSPRRATHALDPDHQDWMEQESQEHAMWMSIVAARQRGNSLSLVAAGPAAAAAAPRPKAPPPRLPLPAVMGRRLVVDVPDKRNVEQLKHDLAVQKELVAQLDQRVRTLEALQRQEPARGGPVRKWWDNDEAEGNGKWQGW